jgi:exopolysaccharide production protein ExoZ
VRFYLAFGLLLLLPWRWAFRVLLAWGLASAAVLAANWGGLTWLDTHLAGRVVNYLCHPSTMQFLVSVGAAYLVRHLPTAHGLDLAVLGLGLVGTALVMQMFQQIRPDTKYFATVLFTVPSVLLVLGCALVERRWRPRFPKPLVALGDASYSTYLVHYLLAFPAVWVLLPDMDGAALVATAWVLVAAIHGLGYLFYLGVEGPLHQAARRWLPA